MTTKKQCKGTNAAGEPCGCRAVGKDGYCAAHRAGGNERMKRLALRGAMAAHGPKGLDPARMGPLETVRDAQRWLRMIAEGVVSGGLKPQEATAGIRAMEAWLSAEKDRVQADDLAALRAEIAEVRESLKAGRKLEVVS